MDLSVLYVQITQAQQTFFWYKTEATKHQNIISKTGEDVIGRKTKKTMEAKE